MMTKVLISVFFLCIYFQAGAVVIYPINQAEILVGSKFDLRVEFDKVIEPKEAIVTINNQDIDTVVKVKPEYIRNENGKGSTLLWKNISIESIGSVNITARTVDVKEQFLSVNWNVYGTGPRKQKISFCL
jgi:alkaline phosphatase